MDDPRAAAPLRAGKPRQPAQPKPHAAGRPRHARRRVLWSIETPSPWRSLPSSSKEDSTISKCSCGRRAAGTCQRMGGDGTCQRMGGDGTCSEHVDGTTLCTLLTRKQRHMCRPINAAHRVTGSAAALCVGLGELHLVAGPHRKSAQSLGSAEARSRWFGRARGPSAVGCCRSG
jgi:hypothetical protein